MEETNPVMKAIVLEAVDNQLRDNNLPETRATYERLLNEGYSDQEARELIAATLLAEMYYVIKHGQEHSEKRYINDLNRLPQLPWD